MYAFLMQVLSIHQRHQGPGAQTCETSKAVLSSRSQSQGVQDKLAAMYGLLSARFQDVT